MGWENLNFLGDYPDDFKKPLQWDWEWMDDGSGPVIFRELGIQDIRIPKYDYTFCTGCFIYMNPLLVMLVSMWNKRKKSGGLSFSQER